MIGQTISHYKILEKLGEGGMGVVYKAQDTKLERLVALKFLPRFVTVDSDEQARFLHETRALSSLNHPHIATIYDVEEVDDSKFIVLEYIEGGTLKQKVKHKLLPLSEMINYAIQIAEGLAYAHKREIIHRDIKTDNVMITSEGQLKITDFGLAKLKGTPQITRMGSTVGTAAYMSPEQAEGQEVDHRSDIFSFGIVLYELITGEVPFRGEHEAALLYEVVNMAPRPLKELRADAPAEFQRIVSKAMEKNPDDRPQHMDELLADLQQLTKEFATRNLLRQAGPPSPRRQQWIMGMTVGIVLALGVGLYYFLQTPQESVSERIMLAILPFENLGSPNDEYFADGITEEIITSLAKVSGLGVISRTSAIRYKKTDKSLKQIGSELGVDYILEGSISWDKSQGVGRVRINPQLIRVSDDTHLWAETYDRVFEQIFELRSDIAQKVTLALDVTLLEPERHLLAAKPTENLEAYNFYLRGNGNFNRTSAGIGGGEKYLRIALQMYRKAVELDSSFALAYSQLSRINTELYWHFDRKAEYLRDAKATVEKSFRLVPGLPEAHLALGSYYYHALEFKEALEQFAVAQRSLPNNPELLAEIGYVQRRQGKIIEALSNFKKAAELDPGRSDFPYAIGQSYHRLRKYSEAASYYERAISLDPGGNVPYRQMVDVYLKQDGNTGRARKLLVEAAGKVDAAELIDRWVWLDVIEAKYQQALIRLSGAEAYNNDSIGYYLTKAEVYGFIGRVELKRAYYDSARIKLERKVQTEFENERLHSQLGIAYAGLGRKEDAIREGKKGADLLPVSRDAWTGLTSLEDLARIYVMVGEYDAALKEIEYLLSIPSDLSVSLLGINPPWAPLRNHPRFQKLMSEGE